MIETNAQTLDSDNMSLLELEDLDIDAQEEIFYRIPNCADRANFCIANPTFKKL